MTLLKRDFYYRYKITLKRLVLTFNQFFSEIIVSFEMSLLVNLHDENIMEKAWRLWNLRKVIDFLRLRKMFYKRGRHKSWQITSKNIFASNLSLKANETYQSSSENVRGFPINFPFFSHDSIKSNFIDLLIINSQYDFTFEAHRIHWNLLGRVSYIGRKMYNEIFK